MIIGLDIFHNVQKRKESRVALCATIDRNFTQFYSKVVPTKKCGETIMGDLTKSIGKAIKAYWKHNKK